eukprot:2258220-Prymnesium_polylepis.1
MVEHMLPEMALFLQYFIVVYVGFTVTYMSLGHAGMHTYTSSDVFSYDGCAKWRHARTDACLVPPCRRRHCRLHLAPRRAFATALSVCVPRPPQAAHAAAVG